MDHLVNENPMGLVGRSRDDATEAESPFGPDDEEGSRAINSLEPLEACVPTIDDIEGPGFKDDVVENADFVQICHGNPCKYREMALYVKQRVELDGRRGCEMLLWCGPRKELQAEIDYGRIQSIDCGINLRKKAVVRVEDSRLVNQHMRKVPIDLPGTMFVCVSKR